MARGFSNIGGIKINGLDSSVTIENGEILSAGDFVQLSKDELSVLKSRRRLELCNTEVKGGGPASNYISVNPIAILTTEARGIYGYTRAVDGLSIFHSFDLTADGTITISNNATTLANFDISDAVQIESSLDAVIFTSTDGKAVRVTWVTGPNSPTVGTPVSYATASGGGQIFEVSSTDDRFLIVWNISNTMRSIVIDNNLSIVSSLYTWSTNNFTGTLATIAKYDDNTFVGTYKSGSVTPNVRFYELTVSDAFVQSYTDQVNTVALISNEDVDLTLSIGENKFITGITSGNTYLKMLPWKYDGAFTIGSVVADGEKSNIGEYFIQSERGVGFRRIYDTGVVSDDKITYSMVHVTEALGIEYYNEQGSSLFITTTSPMRAKSYKGFTMFTWYSEIADSGNYYMAVSSHRNRLNIDGVAKQGGSGGDTITISKGV